MAEYNKSEWIVVGIGGVTCGGKTTLARRLGRALSPVWLFNQDRYFYPEDSPHHVRCGNLEHNNYDILSALDMAAMRRDIIRTLNGDGGAGAGVGTGTTEMGTGTETETIVAPGKKFLVIEGLTVLNYKPIADLCDLKYYLTLELGTCAARRALRVYDPPDIPGYFELCVWPEHLKYKKEISGDRSVRFLSGEDCDLFQRVAADLRRLIGGGHN